MSKIYDARTVHRRLLRPSFDLRSALRRAAFVLLLLSVGGCEACKKEVRGKYYESLEKVGLEKREMLVKRVGKARNAQEEAQEQFEDALEELQALINYDGGELESVYESLKGEFESAENRAQNVRDRVKKVENVASALFEEWQNEIAVFENPTYRRDSEKKLRDTKARYSKLLDKMQQAAASMEPVLKRLQDQVLYLKHNLNAQALGSLDQEAELLQTDVTRLIADMQASIAEADQFIASLSDSPES